MKRWSQRKRCEDHVPQTEIIGNDIAGRVEAAGRNVTQFRPGDHVFGELSWCGFGAYAEFAVAPEKALVLKPANLSSRRLPAIPTAGCTTLQGLRMRSIGADHVLDLANHSFD